jgi:hypothetical protein
MLSFKLMEQGYLFQSEAPVEGYSTFNSSNRRVVNYQLFINDKSHGIKLTYSDGSYDIYESFALNPSSTLSPLKPFLTR